MFGMRSSLYMIAGSKTSSPAKVTATPAAYRASEAYATFPRRYQSGSAVDLLLVSSAGALQRYPAPKASCNNRSRSPHSSARTPMQSMPAIGTATAIRTFWCAH